MALTRKFLTALGIEAEKVDEIISAHSETVEALKEERDGYKANAEKLPEVQKELDALKKTVAEKGDGEDSFEVKYNAIKEEFKNFKADVEAKATRQAKENAYRNLLKEAGVSEKRIDSVVRVSSDAIGKIEIDKDGKVKDADSVKDEIGKEWADFIVQKSVKGASVDNPPEGNGGEPKTTGRAAEIAAKYHESLYGKAKED